RDADKTEQQLTEVQSTRISLQSETNRDPEPQLLAELESLRTVETEQLAQIEEGRQRRLEEMKSSQQDFMRVVADSEPDSKAIVLASEAVEWNHSEPTEESPEDTPWLQIDLQHSENGNGEHHEAGVVASSVQSDYPPFANATETAHELPSLAS